MRASKDRLSLQSPHRACGSSVLIVPVTIQELLGHRDVKTMMIYNHALNLEPRGVYRPLDGPEPVRGECDMRIRLIIFG